MLLTCWQPCHSSVKLNVVTKFCNQLYSIKMFRFTVWVNICTHVRGNLELWKKIFWRIIKNSKVIKKRQKLPLPSFPAIGPSNVRSIHCSFLLPPAEKKIVCTFKLYLLISVPEYFFYLQSFFQNSNKLLPLVLMQLE